MRRIPPAPLFLGLAGVLPFAWGALTILVPRFGDWSFDSLGARAAGRTLLLLYGAIILSFMSGVIWGFATRAKGRHAATLYALSTVPALWALFAGFSTLAPAWWMRLRLLLTALVVPCLVVGLP